MKKIKLVAIAVVVVFIVGFIMCNSFADNWRMNYGKVFNAKKGFHVKVECYGDVRYVVWFTNNNFFTERTIKDAFDITPVGGKVMVVHQLKLFNSEQEAIGFANGLMSFAQCISYNKGIEKDYRFMLLYWDTHPLPWSSKEKQTTKECHSLIVK